MNPHYVHVKGLSSYIRPNSRQLGVIFLTESAGTPSKWKEKLHQLNPHAASQPTIAHCKNASGLSNAPQMLCCWLLLAKSELKGLHAHSASK